MALVTCAGSVLRARIHLPLHGAWLADLVLDTATMPTGQQTIAADGGLSLVGTVVDGGVFLDAAHVRMVGGAGGLAKIVPAAAYRSAQLRDPLGAITQASGESLSSTVSQSVLSTSLAVWTLTSQRAARCLDELAQAAGVGWRILSDGTLWLGAESWSSASLPDGAAILEQHPTERRFAIGTTTPALLPGVNLDGVGNVVAVDHWIEPAKVRTWAWI